MVCRMEVVVGSRMGCGLVDITLGVVGKAATEGNGGCMGMRRERYVIERENIVIEMNEQGIEIVTETETETESIKNMIGKDSGINIFSSSIDNHLYMLAVGLLRLKDQV